MIVSFVVGWLATSAPLLLTCSLDMCPVTLGEHRYRVTCGAHILGSNTVFLPCLIQPFIWWYILGWHRGLSLKIESSICESFLMMKTTTFTNRGGKYTGKVQPNPFYFSTVFLPLLQKVIVIIAEGENCSLSKFTVIFYCRIYCRLTGFG